jgi:hypothetical protein
MRERYWQATTGHQPRAIQGLDDGLCYRCNGSLMYHGTISTSTIRRDLEGYLYQPPGQTSCSLLKWQSSGLCPPRTSNDLNPTSLETTESDTLPTAPAYLTFRSHDWTLWTMTTERGLTQIAQIWCLLEEDGQEDGDFPARQVHLRFLRQGHRQASGRRYLELQELQAHHRWRRLHCLVRLCLETYPTTLSTGSPLVPSTVR